MTFSSDLGKLSHSSPLGSRYPVAILRVSKLSRTSSFVTAMLVIPFSRTACRTSNASNQPHLRGRPVVAPNSFPSDCRIFPSSSNSSVGKGPFPTRVVYALTIPSTPVIQVGPIPEPTHAFPDKVLDDVTNGYVPWSTSKKVPCAPSNKMFLPS